MTEEEVNVGLRAEAAERRRKALTRVETLDLSQTSWPELPHTRVVNAITFVALAGLNRYPHLRGSELRDELAARHEVDPGRLILGNGAAELLSSAARALIEPGQRLLTTWPSYRSATPGRATRHWRSWSSTRGCSSFAPSPRPGAWPACGWATRSGGPVHRTSWPSCSPTWASRRFPRRAPWRRCAAARSSLSSVCE